MIPSPTRPKQKYRCSFALWLMSSAITRWGSANAYCASANGIPCYFCFSASLRSSHSKLDSMSAVYSRYGIRTIRMYGRLHGALTFELSGTQAADDGGPFKPPVRGHPRAPVDRPELQPRALQRPGQRVLPRIGVGF